MNKDSKNGKFPSSVATARRRVSWIIGLMLLAVLFTRLLTLTHNMGLHPDEFVFFYSSESLAHRLLGVTDQYIEVKEYPEGAFVFQMPFHIAAYLLNRLTGKSLYIQTIGRLSSVFYFLAASMIGGIILTRWFPKRKACLPLYALIMVFSVMHLEQSRYGTGDGITACLLMILLLFTAIAQDSAGKCFTTALLVASFATGALSAVKYPLLFFFAVPLSVVFGLTGKGKTTHRGFMILSMAAMVAIAFFLCSPKTAVDPMYVARVIKKEMGSYVTAGNICEVGGPWNHLVSVSLFLTLYSGFPLATIFLVTAWTKERKHRPSDKEGFLFTRVVPCIMLLFFLYNLFVTTLFMRSFYLFFCLSDLYVASEAARWFEEKGLKKRIVLALTVIMIVRGGYYISVLSERQGAARLNEKILAAADSKWQHTILLGPGFFLPFDNGILIDPEPWNIGEAGFCTEEELKMKPGDLLICATQDYSRCNPYFFPISHPQAKQQIESWQLFKTLNHEHYQGQVYPEYYYWLFGYWIKGTTGTDYEFPSNRVYYCRLLREP